MQWERAGKYVMQSGAWCISKTLHGGVPLYSLWKGKALIGIRREAKDSMAEAEAMND